MTHECIIIFTLEYRKRYRSINPAVSLCCNLPLILNTLHTSTWLLHVQSNAFLWSLCAHYFTHWEWRLPKSFRTLFLLQNLLFLYFHDAQCVIVINANKNICISHIFLDQICIAKLHENFFNIKINCCQFKDCISKIPVSKPDYQLRARRALSLLKDVLLRTMQKGTNIAALDPGV